MVSNEHRSVTVSDSLQELLLCKMSSLGYFNNDMRHLLSVQITLGKHAELLLCCCSDVSTFNWQRSFLICSMSTFPPLQLRGYKLLVVTLRRRSLSLLLMRYHLPRSVSCIWSFHEMSTLTLLVDFFMALSTTSENKNGEWIQPHCVPVSLLKKLVVTLLVFMEHLQIW